MCAFSLYSLNLKKQGGGGHSFAISLHGFTRGHPARHYLSLDWRRCTIRPVQQNHGIKVTVTAPKEDNNRKNKCHLTGRSFQIKWTACPLILVTEYMLRFMGVLRRKSTTAKHRTTLHRSVFERSTPSCAASRAPERRGPLAMQETNARRQPAAAEKALGLPEPRVGGQKALGSKSSCSSCPREKEVGGRAPLFLQEIVQPRVTLKKLSLKKKKEERGKKEVWGDPSVLFTGYRRPAGRGGCPRQEAAAAVGFQS